MFADGGLPSIGFAGADVALLVPAPDRRAVEGGVPWVLTVRSCFLEEALAGRVGRYVFVSSLSVLADQATVQGEGGGKGTFRAVVRDRDGFDLVDARPGASVLRHLGEPFAGPAPVAPVRHRLLAPPGSPVPRPPSTCGRRPADLAAVDVAG
ncbi:hypothetical protein GCM10009759_07150 [Kitasatospora saccharophila]|uniref:NAD(P)-binding protein n=1 Tax=Kitasatospora saccharophila TaxID=407973 RepID=A0ABN2WAJ2_9ACTN